MGKQRFWIAGRKGEEDMSYSIEKIIKPTHDLNPIEDIETLGKEDNLVAEYAQRADRLREFMRSVRQLYPKCQFAKESHGFPRLVHVYHSWKPMTMGMIGYGNYRETGGEENFIVWSPNITNDKYSSNSVQYRMKMTKNIKVAQRSVNKFIRDVSITDLTQVFEYRTRHLWDLTASSADTKIVDMFLNMFNKDNRKVILRELQHLIKTDHEFFDPKFGSQAKEIVSMFEKSTEILKERKASMVMVSVEQHTNVGNKFVLARIPDISDYSALWEELGTFTEDTLQTEYPDIFGKLNVLQMCEVNQWVDGVGYKSVPTVYNVVT